jgi:hypothetical protein
MEHHVKALERMDVEDLETGERKVLSTDGAFVFVGMVRSGT